MSSNSDPPPSSIGTGIRPMPFFVAPAWVLGTTLVLALLEQFAAATDIVSGFACQAVAYLLGLFLILRVHAPNRSVRDFLALRRTHFAFYPLAVLLGLALMIPALTVHEWVQHRYPYDDAQDDGLDLLLHGAMPLRVLAGLVIVALGPLLEEIFYRGALFKPLERKYTESRSIVIGITAVLFAMAHVKWQAMIHLAMVGLALGYLRQASGSLIPSVLLHASFNGVIFYGLLTASPDASDADPIIPRWLLAAGCSAVVILLGAVHLLSTRTEAATHAREIDRL